LTLVISMCEADEAEGEGDVIEMFKPVVPSLVKILKGLSSSGYTPEHDVMGISDPFLQVKILGLLRVLGRQDAVVSEQINDILAQVATNTDSSKNVGNSILYEAVLTILDIEADSGLRVLGVNILGKFLANKDNNIRYVALNTLVKVVAVEPNAVQRHRNTILDCLRDPDISIRRRALDLSFTLINADNVQLLVRELLAFLEVADNEFKTTMTSQIGLAADRFAPNKRWHVDTMLRMLKLAGTYIREQILSSFVRLIATSPEQQTYCVQKLYANLREDITQEGLTLASAWVIGEYGDSLLRGSGGYDDPETVQNVQESDIIDLYETILNSAYATPIVSEYIVTSMMKLSARMSEPGQTERIRRLLGGRTADLSVEIQQRAVEYSNLFNYDQVRTGVLERMPAPELRDESRILGHDQAKKKANRHSRRISKQVKTDDLLDLIGGGDEPAPAANGNAMNNQDLLNDILGGDAPPMAAPASRGGAQDIMGMFGSSGSQQAGTPQPSSSGMGDLLGGGAPAVAPSAPVAHTVYSKNELGLTMAVQRNAATGQAQIQAKFRNESAFARFAGVSLQAAVPKTQKLQLQGISKSELEGGEEATQLMRIAPAAGALPAKLRLRLKVMYSKDGGAALVEQVDWTEP